MDFNNLIRIANKNEIKSEKKRSNLKPGLPPPSVTKKEAKPGKGINSTSVRAFLEDQERKEKDDKHRQKPVTTSKVSANDSKSSTSKPNNNVNDDVEIDLKNLFNKNDRRVARLPDSAIPNMMDVLKEREKLRKQKQREEEEEQIRKERELIKEREREREREREEKEKAQRLGLHSSKLLTKSKHSTDQPSDAGKSSTNQFKIPRKNQPPPMSYDALLALATKKQSEPEEPSPPHPGSQLMQNSKLDLSRSLIQPGKNGSTRPNSDQEKSVHLNGDPSKKHNSAKSFAGRNDKIKTNSLQLDRRKAGHDVQIGSHSDRSKSADRIKSNERASLPSQSQHNKSADHGRTNFQSKSSERGSVGIQVKSSDQGSVNSQMKTSNSGSVNARAKSCDRTQVNGQPKTANHRPIGGQSKTTDLVKKNGNLNASKSASVSVSNRVGNSVAVKTEQKDYKNGHKQDSKHSELNNSNKQLTNSKSTSNKSGGAEKSSALHNSSLSVNKKLETCQKPKSKGNEMDNRNNSGVGSKNNNARHQLIKDFCTQCKQLKESGFLSESLVKSLENELKNKLRALAGNKVPANNHKSSENSSTRPSTSLEKSSLERPGMRISTSQLQKNSSKTVMPNSKTVTSNKIGSSNGGNDRALKNEKRPDAKQMSAWDRIQAENKQFKPKPDPAALKRRLEEYSDSEEEDDDEEDDYEDEDDDMDSFIDDGDDDDGAGGDYSMYIRRLMKYDPSKYDDDFDDRSMETSYAQQLKEEAFSSREGRREDIEDMMMEEEEKRQKILKKKAGAKRARLA